MQKLVIIDYGSGNLHSAAKAFERANNEIDAGTSIVLSDEPKEIETADRVVLPGVGAFADCYAGLKAINGLEEVLVDLVQNKKRPFLGICVGMQLLADRGLEHGSTDGLGWISGEVRAIEPEDPNLKIPHMGWNTLEVLQPHPILDSIPTGKDGLHAYFVHSYHVELKSDEHKIAQTNHGGPITALVARDNIVGTQFHPEKSQKLGLKLIANFLKWRP